MRRATVAGIAAIVGAAVVGLIVWRVVLPGPETVRSAAVGQGSRAEPVQSPAGTSPAATSDSADGASLDVLLRRAGIPVVREGGGRPDAGPSPGSVIAKCPFDLQVGLGIKLMPDSTEPSIVYSDVDYRASTIASASAGQWRIEGAEGNRLRVWLRAPEVDVEIPGATATVSKARRITVVAGVRRPGKPDDWAVWRDQPFRVLKDGTVAATFEETAGYRRALR